MSVGVIFEEHLELGILLIRQKKKIILRESRLKYYSLSEAHKYFDLFYKNSPSFVKDGKTTKRVL